MRSASVTVNLSDDTALSRLIGVLGSGGAAAMVEAARDLPGVTVEERYSDDLGREAASPAIGPAQAPDDPIPPSTQPDGDDR